MKVLVADGAGYIGSHVVKALLRAGHGVTALDNLSNGHADSVRSAELVRGGGKPEATALRVNGEDFDTADGSCVRDYVHVTDLCDAHLRALVRLEEAGAPGFKAIKLGGGKDFSVKEMIRVCRVVTGLDIRYAVGPRRPGDPAALVADARRAREVLGWKPHFGRLRHIVRTAWNWMLARAGA